MGCATSAQGSPATVTAYPSTDWEVTVFLKMMTETMEPTTPLALPNTCGHMGMYRYGCMLHSCRCRYNRSTLYRQAAFRKYSCGAAQQAQKAPHIQKYSLNSSGFRLDSKRTPSSNSSGFTGRQAVFRKQHLLICLCRPSRCK